MSPGSPHPHAEENLAQATEKWEANATTKVVWAEPGWRDWASYGQGSGQSKTRWCITRGVVLVPPSDECDARGLITAPLAGSPHSASVHGDFYELTASPWVQNAVKDRVSFAFLHIPHSKMSRKSNAKMFCLIKLSNGMLWIVKHVFKSVHLKQTLKSYLDYLFTG